MKQIRQGGEKRTKIVDVAISGGKDMRNENTICYLYIVLSNAEANNGFAKLLLLIY